MEKSYQEEKSRPLLIDKNQSSKLAHTNYCVSGIMSRCSAGIVWEDQKRCRFSKKSSVASRCMHFIVSLDGHCDCVDAQREIRKIMATEKITL